MAEPAIRKIIHVDMDAFYASVEQRDDPALRGRPVAVGSSARRGVVAAASYEARAFGVRSALPSVTALRRCPDLVFVPPRFEVYRAVSRQVHAIFAEFTDLVEPLALDEAYLDVTANRAGLPSAWATARAIRARIHAETGLTASAGVSYNKFLAKLASDQRKPNGQFAIQPGEGAAFVAALPVDRFHGVGPATARRMHEAGIRTGADLRAWSREALVHRFGKAGGWYHGLARGEDHRPVNPHRLRKSVGSETTFGADLTDPAAIERGVLAMADDVWAWCERTGTRGRTVTVKIKWADFRQSTRSHTPGGAVTSRAELHRVSLALIRSVLPAARGIRLVGVTLSGLGGRAEDPVAPELALAGD
ncbi:DNA polymerase IV [Novosphingobium flavum]|uniref:DNA polymerase IV n=1 Tax=Novosphingobium aerophilum TaxID=2839843 RepID=A0A7X1F6I8_9SPHN|nr:MULTISPECIES: DNA polymerase IV [Novosphingobium]MBC2651281.1 DNA polymerase IV [Novosphingobium aerophilum]MBC2661253.1 DNA polymerase IV [Novosphingobium aerophilum]